MKGARLLFAAAIAACIAGHAAAQSFNIDLDIGSPPEAGGGAPSSAFAGAANQRGFWDPVYASGPVVPTNLLGLDGSVAAAQMVATRGTGAYGGSGYTINTGDYRLLLNDYSLVGGEGPELNYHFSRFQPGHYLIYTYAVNATGVQVNTVVTVLGSINPVQVVTGPMPGNQFIQGITHSIHDLTLSGNSFDIDITGTWPYSEVNGFQIVAVPEPASALACLLGLGSLLARRKRK